MHFGFVALAVAMAAQGVAQAPAAREVQIRSSRDGASQPTLFYVPVGSDRVANGAAAPLVICLHSWSSNYKSAEYMADILKECEMRKWIFLSPDFRGPNNRMEACASELAVSDVIDAVAYAKLQANVDPKRVYLVGGSGGGHMALVMAGMAPDLWAAVSAWVPITDLAAWYRFSKAEDPENGYWKSVERSCGGPPGSPDTDREFRQRSPLSTLQNAKSVRIDIEAGIQDGHNGRAVPISHSLRAFNILARVNGQPDKALSEEDIGVMTREARIPEHLAGERHDDGARKHRILFQRSAGPARITIFDGGHVLDPQAAMRWFASLSPETTTPVASPPVSAVWHKQAVTLDFGTSVWFRVNTGEWASGKEATITQEGINKVTVRKSRSGADEEVREVRIDLSPPAIRLVTSPPLDQEGGLYYATSATEFAFEATDTYSGVAAIEISLDNGKFVPYSAPLRLSKGSHELRCRATDLAGNESHIIRGRSLTGGETNVLAVEVK